MRRALKNVLMTFKHVMMVMYSLAAAYLISTLLGVPYHLSTRFLCQYGPYKHVLYFWDFFGTHLTFKNVSQKLTRKSIILYSYILNFESNATQYS